MKRPISPKMMPANQRQPMDVAWSEPAEFKVPIPKDEQERLADLLSYKLLDTLPEEDLDNITKLAAQICETPIALLSLIDAERQWFKAKVGVTISETSRNVAFCAHAIMERDLFVVRDASKDKRFASNPLVTSTPKIRFYAGAPLITPDNHALGTLCVIDRVPRVLTPGQTEALRALSHQVMAQLEMRRRLINLDLRLLRCRRNERQLQEAFRTIKAAQREKDELFLKLSHELRATLGGLLALTKQMLAARLTPRQQRALRTMQSEEMSLLNLANNLAVLSKAPAAAPAARAGAERSRPGSSEQL